VNKVNELNKSVPIDVDRVVAVKAQDDMKIDNDPIEVDNNLQDLIEIHNDPMEVD
jgi:CRISPR/Cas system-associated exonuclease Cas4 (RecB family)